MINASESAQVENDNTDKPAQRPISPEKAHRQASGIGAASDTPRKDEGDPASVTSSQLHDSNAKDISAKSGGHAASAEAGKLSHTGKIGNPGAFFNWLSQIGPLALLFALLCQVWPDFWQALGDKAFYCPAEIKNITAVLQTLADNAWLKPESGDSYGIPWPGYIWFSCLIAPVNLLIFKSADTLFPLASALSAALALVGAWCLAIGAGFGKRAALACGLILLCMPIFVPLAHFSGPAGLAAFFLLFSILFFYKGWSAEHGGFWLPLAFVFTGLGGFTGGFFHLALPLVASAIFLIWCGALKRAQRADAIFGFVLLLLLVCGWLAAIILNTRPTGYLSYLARNLVQPVGSTPNLFWLPALMAGLGILPWLLMMVCVSWHKVLLNAPAELKLSRKENSGASILWIALFCGLALSVIIPVSQTQTTAVGLACLAAPLLGKAFIRLSGTGVRFFYLITAVILFLAGVALLALNFSFSQEIILNLLPCEITPKYKNMLLNLPALPLMGAICVAASLIMIRFITANRHGNGLVYCAAISIILCQPATLMLVPEMAANNDVELSLLSDIKKTVGVPAVSHDNAEKILPAMEKPADTAVTKDSTTERAPDAEINVYQSNDTAKNPASHEKAE